MKHLLHAAVMAVILVAAAGCSPRFVKPEFVPVATDTLITSGNTQCHVRYHFVSIANTAQNPALQAIEEANVEYFFGLEGFRGTAREALTEALIQLGGDLDIEQTAQYSEQVEAQAAVVDSVLVYTITSSSYMGGAHGMQAVTAHNYSLAGGYELSLGDLFSPAQREALDLLIRHKIYDRFGVSDDEGLAEQGFFPDFIQATENFAITPDGIVFYHNPYDIGCYALGMIEIPISKTELDTIAM